MTLNFWVLHFLSTGIAGVRHHTDLHADRDRTLGFVHAKQTLYHLSHIS